MFCAFDDAGKALGKPVADVEAALRAGTTLSQTINQRVIINRIDAEGAASDNIAIVWPSGHIDLSLLGSTIA